MNDTQDNTGMETQTKNEQSPLTAKSKPERSKTWMWAAIILGLLLAGLAALYYLQYTDLKSANRSKDELTNTNKTLTSQLQANKAGLSALQTKYKALQNSLNPTSPSVSQADLDLSVASAQYVNPNGTVTSSGSWLGVRVTLTNNTASPIALDASNFSLKDSSDNSYKVVGFEGATTLPDGWGSSTIKNQTLEPKAKVTGNLIFQLPNKNLSDFVLLNDTKAYTVKVTQ